MRTKVYISGPITGYPELNLPAFRTAETRLRAMGFHPIVPHDLFDGIQHEGPGAWEEYMKGCVKALVDCCYVLTLDNWHDSKGATIEVDLARKLGIDVISIANISRLETSEYSRKTVDA